MTDVDGPVRRLLDSTDDLLADLDQAGDDASRSVEARLRASVVGPLQQAAGTAAVLDRAENDMPPRSEPVGPASSEPVGPASSGAASAAQLGGRLWELARAATELWCRNLMSLASARRSRPCKTSPSD